jgi:adenylosuccinate synthase
MINVIGIIGASYGDEGKGLLTDYFAYHHDDSIVCRFQGSAQAGHTVVTPDGKRHVFSHFGSGTFSNRPTLLSEFFVCHPLIFKRERMELLLKLNDTEPRVFVHKNCLVTTPIDMIINQILEIRRDRDGSCHGSVGLGFNETIERNLIGDFKLTVEDLRQGKEHLKTKIHHIRHNWLNNRLLSANSFDFTIAEQYLLFEPCSREQELLNCLRSDRLWFDFQLAIDYFLDHIIVLDNYNFNDYGTIIFEGAQGLMLDQDYGVFPHVTRSNTGVKNIIKILDHIDNIETINVYYITRAYVTRHGHGPMFGEQELPYEIIDETNKPHEFQGTIRYAPLSFNRLYDAIFTDYDQLANASKEYSDKSMCRVAITCLDQIKDVGLCYDYLNEDIPPHLVTKRSGNEFIDILLDHANIVSYGPTRKDVVINNPLIYVD